MEIEVTVRGSGIPDQAKEFARDKVSRISRIFDRVGRIHISLEMTKELSRAHAVAHLDSGATLVAETNHAELQSAIEHLSDKLESQVRKEKERLIGRTRKPHKENHQVEDRPVDGEDPSYSEAIREELDED